MIRTNLTPFNISKNLVDKNVSEIRPVIVNLGKPTLHVTFMLDGSGLNIIKESFIPKGKTINYTNILKLNGINKYLVYTLGEITLNKNHLKRKEDNTETFRGLYIKFYKF